MVINPEAAAVSLEKNEKVFLHGQEAFQRMRLVGSLAADCLDQLTPLIVPGVTTEEIDRFVRQYAIDHRIFPATLNYRGYKKSCCTSVNHVVCHGIPEKKPLQQGDIVNVDVTFIHDGWHGDSSRMYAVGPIRAAAQRLLNVTYECLMRGIAVVRPGIKTGAIGHAIQTWAETHRCSVVRIFCGHGIGRVFHAPPNILHYGKESDGMEIQPGMIFTIEPMINLGKPDVKILADGWTAVTRDKSLSAQYEHMIGVTATGHEIFTRSASEIASEKP